MIDRTLAGVAAEDEPGLTMTPEAASIRNYVHEVLRPMVQVDGGDVVFEGLVERRVKLVFRGDCSRCVATECGLVPWIAGMIEKRFGRRFEIEARMQRPYFYR
jgi:Fe-S cluster biogenesis protein NfuA